MYLIVYYATSFISSNIFPAIILKKSLKYQDKIKRVNLKLESVESNELTNEKLLTVQNIKNNFSIPNSFLDLYEYISMSLKGRISFEKFIFEINGDRNEIQSTLNLLFRALIAIIIYFIKLPIIGIGLFIFLIITIIILIIVFMCGLLILKTLPYLIHKIKFEMDNLLELRKNNPQTE
ncbi:MAG: hypothetical protein IPO63_10205 [Bacteroidetes bacterium]|nr:hypothetical protein [Bacteroidota bacterium]